MTLIEVMFGMVVVGMTALAALSALMFALRVSDSNLRALAAMENARAVAEQLMTIDFASLTAPTLPVDVPSRVPGSMFNGIWNNRTDDLANTPGMTSDDLVMSIKPEVTLSNDAAGMTVAQVIVHFSWEDSSFFRRRLREDALTMVRSPVVAY